jgi:predicted transcriptional regulator
MTKSFKPTESELEILSILWDKQNATVREVHEIVQQSKNIGYTTTLKLMQIMHEKGMVSRDESSKTHIYTPCFNKEKAQEQYLGKMIKTLFSGSASDLVLQALGNNETSKDELIAIKHLIATLEKNANQ